jgi:hypothetical protein
MLVCMSSHVVVNVRVSTISSRGHGHEHSVLPTDINALARPTAVRTAGGVEDGDIVSIHTPPNPTTTHRH